MPGITTTNLRGEGIMFFSEIEKVRHGWYLWPTPFCAIWTEFRPSWRMRLFFRLMGMRITEHDLKNPGTFNVRGPQQTGSEYKPFA